MGKSHCLCSELGMLLAGLRVQVGLLGRLPNWVGLLAGFWGHVEPLPGFCNHLWLGSDVTGMAVALVELHHRVGLWATLCDLSWMGR